MRSIRHLIPIALLVISAVVFLKIDITATEEFFQLIKNFLVFLHQLNIKSRLNFYSPFTRGEIFWISDINGKTAFTINQTYDVII